MLEISNKTRVILPRWIWDKAKDKSEFKSLIVNYMKRYPGYKILELHKYYAVCERGETDEVRGLFERKRDENKVSWD